MFCPLSLQYSPLSQAALTNMWVMTGLALLMGCECAVRTAGEGSLEGRSSSKLPRSHTIPWLACASPTSSATSYTPALVQKRSSMQEMLEPKASCPLQGTETDKKHTCLEKNNTVFLNIDFPNWVAQCCVQLCVYLKITHTHKHTHTQTYTHTHKHTQAHKHMHTHLPASRFAFQ